MRNSHFAKIGKIWNIDILFCALDRFSSLFARKRELVTQKRYKKAFLQAMSKLKAVTATWPWRKHTSGWLKRNHVLAISDWLFLHLMFEAAPLLDAGPHTDRFYNKWGQKYWDLWQNSLPLILPLSSPGWPEIIIFGRVGAILQRPTMFRMHNLIRQVDKKKVDSIMKSCFMQKHSQSMQLDLRSLLLDTSPQSTLKTEFVIKRKTIVKSSFTTHCNLLSNLSSLVPEKAV